MDAGLHPLQRLRKQKSEGLFGNAHFSKNSIGKSIEVESTHTRHGSGQQTHQRHRAGSRNDVGDKKDSSASSTATAVVGGGAKVVLKVEDLIPISKANAWRSVLNAELLGGIKVSNVGGNSPLCSAWAMHDSRPLMVFSNTGSGSGGMVLDQSTLSRVWDFQVPFSATCCDFDGSVVVFGDIKGDCYMARPDFGAAQFEPIWQQYSLSETTSLEELPCFESRKSVSMLMCCPGDRAFYTATNMRLHRWDYERPREPVFSVQVWPFGTQTSCGTVDPESGTVCLLGSTNGRVQMLDNRIESKSRICSPIWTCTRAHPGGSVRSVQWHPQMTTLFSSAGDDGCILLWDSRQTGKSLIEIRHSHGISIFDTQWSVAHPEMLASAGIDSSVCIWNYAKSPEERRAASIPPLSNMRPLGLAWHGNSLILGDSGGGFIDATLERPFLTTMQPRHSLGPAGDQIASLLYLRDLVPAFSSVVERIDQLSNAGSYEQAWSLIRLCYPIESSQTKDPPTAPELQQLFSDAAINLPARIPIPEEAAALFQSVKRQKLILDMHQVLVRNAWRDALNLTDRLCSHFEKHATSDGGAQIQPSLLRDIVQMVLRYHYLSGITMGCKLLRAMSEEEYARHAGLTRLLLSPTVFDGFSGPMSQVPTGLDFVLTNQKVGLSQVDFVRDFTSRLWGETPFPRLDKMMRKTEQNMISVCQLPNRVYVMALIQNGSYHKFLLVYVTLACACSGCEFSTLILPKILSTLALPMMEEWVSAVLAEPFDVSKARQVLSLACVILRSSTIMPSSALSSASSWMIKTATVVPRSEAAALHTHVTQEVSTISVVDDSIKAFLATMARMN